MYTSYIMRRTQIYLSEEQGRYLARRSKAAGTTVSELIRDALDRTYLDPKNRRTQTQRMEVVRSSAGAWKGRKESGKQYVERLRGTRRLARLHGVR